MKIALLVISILAMIVNVLTTLCSVVFLAAGGANSTPSQLLFIKRMMLAFGIVGPVCLIGAIVLSVKGLYGWSIAVSLVPVAFAIVFFVWAFVTEV